MGKKRDPRDRLSDRAAPTPDPKPDWGIRWSSRPLISLSPRGSFLSEPRYNLRARNDTYLH